MNYNKKILTAVFFTFSMAFLISSFYFYNWKQEEINQKPKERVQTEGKKDNHQNHKVSENVSSEDNKPFNEPLKDRKPLKKTPLISWKVILFIIFLLLIPIIIYYFPRESQKKEEKPQEIFKILKIFLKKNKDPKKFDFVMSFVEKPNNSTKTKEEKEKEEKTLRNSVEEIAKEDFQYCHFHGEKKIYVIDEFALSIEKLEEIFSFGISSKLEDLEEELPITYNFFYWLNGRDGREVSFSQDVRIRNITFEEIYETYGDGKIFEENEIGDDYFFDDIYKIRQYLEKICRKCWDKPEKSNKKIIIPEARNFPKGKFFFEPFIILMNTGAFIAREIMDYKRKIEKKSITNNDNNIRIDEKEQIEKKEKDEKIYLLGVIASYKDFFCHYLPQPKEDNNNIPLC